MLLCVSYVIMLETQGKDGCAMPNKLLEFYQKNYAKSRERLIASLPDHLGPKTSPCRRLVSGLDKAEGTGYNISTFDKGGNILCQERNPNSIRKKS